MESHSDQRYPFSVIDNVHVILRSIEQALIIAMGLKGLPLSDWAASSTAHDTTGLFLTQSTVMPWPIKGSERKKSQEERAREPSNQKLFGDILTRETWT